MSIARAGWPLSLASLAIRPLPANRSTTCHGVSTGPRAGDIQNRNMTIVISTWAVADDGPQKAHFKSVFVSGWNPFLQPSNRQHNFQFKD